MLVYVGASQTDKNESEERVSIYNGEVIVK